MFVIDPLPSPPPQQYRNIIAHPSPPHHIAQTCQGFKKLLTPHNCTIQKHVRVLKMHVCYDPQQQYVHKNVRLLIIDPPQQYHTQTYQNACLFIDPLPQYHAQICQAL